MTKPNTDGVGTNTHVNGWLEGMFAQQRSRLPQSLRWDLVFTTQFLAREQTSSPSSHKHPQCPQTVFFLGTPSPSTTERKPIL